MPFNIYQTTAEEIISSVEAVLLKRDGADVQLVANFLTTNTDNAQYAILMAVELGFIKEDDNLYYPLIPLASYLCTSNSHQKAAVLRFQLEEYEPYKIFKSRLRITDSVQDSATQTRAILNITADRLEIGNTLISLGTFSNSLKTKGAGKYTPSTSNEYSFITIVNDVIENRQTAEIIIRQRLGEDICNWIDPNNVLNPIITSFQFAANAENDPRSPIVHFGNAFESFLEQIGNHYQVNLNNAHGINAKMARIRQAGHLTQKHENICKYIGHIRNACDHGVDQEINDSWDISPDTGREYVHVGLTSLRSIYDAIQGNYII